VEYVPGKSTEELDNLNDTAAEHLAEILESACREHDASIALLPMHSVRVGGDDRLFSRRVQDRFADGRQASAERRYLTIGQLLHALQDADVAVAMRYHGHLFCMAMGIPFLSVDYTGTGGKVQSLLERIGYQDFAVRWNDFDADEAEEKLNRIVGCRESLSRVLREKTSGLVRDLHRAYANVFGVGVPGAPEVVDEDRVEELAVTA
jgi:polysaccharide pyruvyl transferase WcaK-like protein